MWMKQKSNSWAWIKKRMVFNSRQRKHFAIKKTVRSQGSREPALQIWFRLVKKTNIRTNGRLDGRDGAIKSLLSANLKPRTHTGVKSGGIYEFVDLKYEMDIYMWTLGDRPRECCWVIYLFQWLASSSYFTQWCVFPRIVWILLHLEMKNFTKIYNF